MNPLLYVSAHVPIGIESDNVVASSLIFIESIPRFFGSKNFSSEMDYWYGSAFLGFPGVFIGLLCLIGLALFVFLRFGGDGCGGKNPLPAGYPTSHRYIPLVFTYILCIIMCVCSTWGFAYNENFSISVVGENGLTSRIYTMTVDLVNTLDGFLSTTNSQGPLEILSDLDTILTTANDEKVTNLDPIWVDFDVSGLNTERSDLSSIEIAPTVNDGLANPHSYSCASCALVFDENLINDEIDLKVIETLNGASSIHYLFSELMFAVQDDIESNAATAIENITNVRDKVDEIRVFVEDYIFYLEDYNPIRDLLVLILCITPFLFIIGVSLGVTFKKSLPFIIVYLIAYFTAGMNWILFGVHLPTSKVLMEACEWIDIQQSTLSEKAIYGPTFQACIDDESLIDLFDLRGPLNFTNYINQLRYHSSDAFSIITLNNLKNEFESKDPNIFGFDTQTLVDDEINWLNNFQGTAYDRSDIIANYVPFNSTDTPRFDTLRDINLPLETNLQAVIDANIVIIDEIIAELLILKTAYINIENPLLMINLEIKDVLIAGNDIHALSSCTGIAQSFLNLKDDVCENGLKAVSTLTFIFFLMGFFGLPVIFLVTATSKRFPHPKGWRHQKKVKKNAYSKDELLDDVDLGFNDDDISLQFEAERQFRK